MSLTLEATFDGTVFHPIEPIKLMPNTHVRLVIEIVEENFEKPKSFLDVARSLNLRGPADWSSRVDDYLYGTKSLDNE